MARATTTTNASETPEPELQLSRPIVGEPVLVRGVGHDGVDAGMVVRVHTQLADGAWLVNVRTFADGPMSKDRWLTSVAYVVDEAAAGSNQHACWPPVPIG